MDESDYQQQQQGQELQNQNLRPDLTQIEPAINDVLTSFWDKCEFTDDFILNMYGRFLRIQQSVYNIIGLLTQFQPVANAGKPFTSKFIIQTLIDPVARENFLKLHQPKYFEGFFRDSSSIDFHVLKYSTSAEEHIAAVDELQRNFINLKKELTELSEILKSQNSKFIQLFIEASSYVLQRMFMKSTLVASNE